MNDLVTNRDAVARAAAIFDEHSRTITDLQDKLNNAIAELEARRTRIEQLELSLAEERTRNAALQNERDLAVLERSELAVMFYNIKAQLDSFEVPLPALPRKPKKNGKHIVPAGTVDPQAIKESWEKHGGGKVEQVIVDRPAGSDT